MTDFVVLSADVDIEAAVRAVVARPHSVGIREIDVEYLRHPGHDPGVFATAHQLLAPYRNIGVRALAVLDFAWESNPCKTALEVERQVSHRLRDDWETRAAVVAIEPEVEVWLWSTSPHVAPPLGWDGTVGELREWLGSEGLWIDGEPKPQDPKEAFERACRRTRTVPSSSVFGDVLSKVSLRSCTDPAFRRLLAVLSGWFPAPSTGDV